MTHNICRYYFGNTVNHNIIHIVPKCSKKLWPSKVMEM